MKSTVSLVIPEDTYVLGYKELVENLEEIMEGEETARIYVLSKFAQPGLLYRFKAELGSTPDTRFYIATGGASRHRLFQKENTGEHIRELPRYR